MTEEAAREIIESIRVNAAMKEVEFVRKRRRIMSMRLQGDTFIDILLGGQSGILHYARNLPKDVRVVSVHTEWELCPPTLCVLLESEQFEEVRDGEYPPPLLLELYRVDVSSCLESVLTEEGGG